MKKLIMSEIEKIIECIERNPEIKECFPENLITLLNNVDQKWTDAKLDRPFRIVFCGVFSSGKTSLINYLLDTNNLFPVGIEPVTKMVTRIRYGKQIYGLYKKDGVEYYLNADEIGQTIRGKKEFSVDDNEITVFIPAKILEDNIEIIDTPGISDEEALYPVSMAAIYKADMAVLCCCSAQLGTIDEKNLIYELDEIVSHYCMVISRYDNLNDDTEKQDVLRSAQYLMKGHGNPNNLINVDSDLVFPLNAAGDSDSVKPFITYLKKIIEDKNIRDMIQMSSKLL